MTRRLLPAVLTVVALIAAGCSGDDTTEPSSPTTSTPSSSTVETTSSTAPVASSTTTASTTSPDPPASTSPTSAPTTSTPADPLTAAIEDLLARYDAAVTTILTDPTVTSDPTSPAVTEYLALFAPGSAFAQGALTAWAQDAAAGRSYRAGPGGAMIESSLVEVTEASDAEASFTACAVNSIQVLDSAGNVVESSGGVTFVQATAELFDGAWVLRDLSQSGGDCQKQGPGG